jgi:hypothetical protein
MKTYWGVEVHLHLSWPRHYTKVNGQLHAPATLPRGKRQCRESNPGRLTCRYIDCALLAALVRRDIKRHGNFVWNIFLHILYTVDYRGRGCS